MGRSGGKWFFEVEVLDAVGETRVGIAGTNFRGSKVGGDEVSWAIYTDGDTSHRLVPDCASPRSVLAPLAAPIFPFLSPIHAHSCPQSDFC